MFEIFIILAIVLFFLFLYTLAYYHDKKLKDASKLKDGLYEISFVKRNGQRRHIELYYRYNELEVLKCIKDDYEDEDKAAWIFNLAKYEDNIFTISDARYKNSGKKSYLFVDKDKKFKLSFTPSDIKTGDYKSWFTTELYNNKRFIFSLGVRCYVKIVRNKLVFTGNLKDATGFDIKYFGPEHKIETINVPGYYKTINTNIVIGDGKESNMIYINNRNTEYRIRCEAPDECEFKYCESTNGYYNNLNFDTKSENLSVGVINSTNKEIILNVIVQDALIGERIVINLETFIITIDKSYKLNK